MEEEESNTGHMHGRVPGWRNFTKAITAAKTVP